MKKQMHNDKLVSLRIPSSTYAAILRRAEEAHATPSKVMRHALVVQFGKS